MRLPQWIKNKLDVRDLKPLQIRYEKIVTGKNISFRLLFVSDIHLTRAKSKRIQRHLLRSVRHTQPDAILIGGDLVDTISGLLPLKMMMSQLQDYCPVLTVAGNHDRWVGLDKVRDYVEAGGGIWLTDDRVHLKTSSKTPLIVQGNLPTTTQEDGYQILLTHHPKWFPDASKMGIDLMLSGHLHGCQFVSHHSRDLLYPGAWFFKWNGLRFAKRSSTLIVGRGASDTLPIRWNCPREVVLCHLV